MSLVIDIKVIPSAGKQYIVLDKTGIIKVYLKSIPEQGKANKELISIIAKKLKINKDDVSILLGKTSRKKRIKIEKEITHEEFLSILVDENQLKIWKK